MNCPRCSCGMEGHGAESRGDGDIYDLWVCWSCFSRHEIHASYCECGCGGGVWHSRDLELDECIRFPDPMDQ